MSTESYLGVRQSQRRRRLYQNIPHTHSPAGPLDGTVGLMLLARFRARHVRCYLLQWLRHRGVLSHSQLGPQHFARFH